MREQSNVWSILVSRSFLLEVSRCLWHTEFVLSCGRALVSRGRLGGWTVQYNLGQLFPIEHHGLESVLIVRICRECERASECMLVDVQWIINYYYTRTASAKLIMMMDPFRVVPIKKPTTVSNNHCIWQNIGRHHPIRAIIVLPGALYLTNQTTRAMATWPIYYN